MLVEYTFASGTKGLSNTQLLVMLAVVSLYLVTYVRAIWTAFTQQGFFQGLLAVFFYPLYLMWNVTSLVKETKLK